MNRHRDDAGKIVQQMAMQIVFEVTEKGAFANLELEKRLHKSSLSADDKKVLTEMVNGTIRMLKHLDWVLNLFLSITIDRQNPLLRNILRISLYQLLFMDKTPDYAVVNNAVELAKRRVNKSLANVVNGVLRNIIRNRGNLSYPHGQTEFLAVYYSHPEWLVKYLLNLIGEQKTEKILQYNNQPGKITLRTNLLKIDRNKLLGKLENEQIVGRKSDLTPWGIIIDYLGKPLAETDAYSQGYFYVQNDASMLAAAILNPNKGDTIGDLCCGLGGKTTHLAEMIMNNGMIRAFDIYARKIEILKENCARLGIDIILGSKMDVLDLDSATNRCDKVLLDVPCSGLGVLNRRADSRWNKNLPKILELQKLQIKLINKAGGILNENGLLLYSTCTIAEEENQEVIGQFLDKNRDFRLQSFDQQIAFFPLDAGDKQAAKKGMLTILPGKYDTDGMFYALLRRKSRN